VSVVFAGNRYDNIRRFRPRGDQGAGYDRSGRVGYSSLDASVSRPGLSVRGVLDEKKQAKCTEK
jgi:hypothetical protein